MHSSLLRVKTRLHRDHRVNVWWRSSHLPARKIASSRRQMAGSPPNFHTMVPNIAHIHDVLKVKVEVKGHVIRALLWCHEMFAIQYLPTFCLYMHSLYKAPLHSPSSVSVRQLDVMSTSWNELFRHWWSGCSFRCVRSPLTWYVNFSFVHLQYITSYVRPFWWSLVIIRDNYSSLVFVVCEMFFAFHNLLYFPNIAAASPIRLVIFILHFPSSVSRLPRYTNSPTCSVSVFSILLT